MTAQLWQIVAACLGLTVIIAVFLHWQNYGLKVTRYTFSHPDMPQGLKGFRIVHISDFHNTAQLKDKIVSFSQAEKPDIIAITGDLIDCRHTDIPSGLALAQRLPQIAPVYYVTGNHEARLDQIGRIKEELASYGINVMDNSRQLLEYNGAHFTLLGVQDPRFYAPDLRDEEDKQTFRERLLSLAQNDGTFKVLLSHRPEFIHTYRDAGIALALTGHAHGGQFGIPFTDIGVFVPNQGLFPKYARGLKKLDNLTEIISRGIGNSGFPFRLFNYPEIVVVEFE